MFLELGIFYNICHLSFKSFFPLEKTYAVLRKKACVLGVVCLIKSHRAWGQPALFNYQVQVESGQVVPIKAEGLHVEWEVSMKSVLAEGKKG